MTRTHLTPDRLRGKVIDIHAHVGVSLKAYACLEYPYGQSLEGLYYRQRAAGVDVNVVFPYGLDLFFDLKALTEGTLRPADAPLSPVPYGTENRTVLSEIFVFCPELRERFIPFVSVDPARRVAEQLAELCRLEAEFPICGIKISPVSCQAKITALLDVGRDFVDFARERDIPFLLHTTGDPNEGYSRPEFAFEVVDANPDVRFCLAHCICFDRKFLDMTRDRPNVWFDTAAMKIQVRMVHEDSPLVPPPAARFDADYSDHRKVTLALAETYPDKLIWGTDSPAYSYICRRRQAENSYAEFRLKATYEDEKAALDFLPPDLRTKASNTNSLRFLFGDSDG